jgi:hypothetical protein
MRQRGRHRPASAAFFASSRISFVWVGAFWLPSLCVFYISIFAIRLVASLKGAKEFFLG